MTPPTPAQKRILDFVKQYLAEREISPSYQEIADSLGYASLATVHKHLANLRDRGHLQFDNSSRTIRLCSLEADELEPMRQALHHALHRSHEVSTGCSACVKGLELSRARP